jgi:diguanylate cyclase
VPADIRLITSVANQLLEANASTAPQASERVLAQLVEHFDLHYAFLRYSDHNIRASVLAAEWPPLRRRQPRPVRCHLVHQ